MPRAANRKRPDFKAAYRPRTGEKNNRSVTVTMSEEKYKKLLKVAEVRSLNSPSHVLHELMETEFMHWSL